MTGEAELTEASKGGPPGIVLSSDGLGVIDRLRQCLPMIGEGPDHKIWCTVLAADLREAADEIERLRSDFATMRELVINGAHEAALRDAAIARKEERPLIHQPMRHGYI